MPRRQQKNKETANRAAPAPPAPRKLRAVCRALLPVLLWPLTAAGGFWCFGQLYTYSGCLGDYTLLLQWAACALGLFLLLLLPACIWRAGWLLHTALLALPCLLGAAAAETLLLQDEHAFLQECLCQPLNRETLRLGFSRPRAAPFSHSTLRLNRNDANQLLLTTD